MTILAWALVLMGGFAIAAMVGVMIAQCWQALLASICFFLILCGFVWALQYLGFIK
jgi:hypothetical protein